MPRPRPAEGQPAPVVCPCFTPGVSIMTEAGPRRIETLRPGDRVVTRDNGLQEILWIGARKLTIEDLLREPQLHPVLIQQGSLGDGLPERDMLVSPRHRVLVERGRTAHETAREIDTPEALISAQHLIDHRQICGIDAPGITYVHFLCDRHEVVLSNGLWTESFQPSDAALAALENAQRVELGRMFPALEGLAAYAPARPRVVPQRPDRPAEPRLRRPVPVTEPPAPAP